MVGDFLRVYTKDVLHLDSTTTSRDEGAHGMIKRDLEVSTNDFLTALRSMERTLTHQHLKVIDESEKSTFLFLIASFCFVKSLGRFQALPLLKLQRFETTIYQLVHQEPCTGLTKENVGNPMH